MELYLKGQKADLPPDAVFAITVQSNDITKPDSVQSSYSNTLTLPYTECNNALLDNAHDPKSIGGAPYQKLEATVLQDGVEVVPLPQAYLQQASEGYEVQVFSGAVDLFERLGDKSIRDLDLSRFNHAWNFDNVHLGAGSWRDYTNGYIYEPINRGKPFDAGNLPAEDLYPSVFVRTVFEQLLEEAGVNYSGIEDVLWDRLVLPFSNDKPVCVQPPGKSGLFETFPDPWTIEHYGVIKVVIQAEMTRISTNPNAVPKLWMQLNYKGKEVQAQTVEMTTPGFHQLTATLRIEQDMVLADLELRVHPLNWTADSANTSTGTYFRYYKFEEEAVFLSEWDVARNLPDIKQKDFFKAIRALFDLLVSFDPYSNTLQLTPFNKLLENKAKALDWSSRLVYPGTSQRVPVQYRFGEFARRSWWRYKEDAQGGDGDGYLAVEDEQLEAEKNLVELPFAASQERAGMLYFPVYERVYGTPGDYVKSVQKKAGLDMWTNLMPAGGKILVERAAEDDPKVAFGWAIYRRVDTAEKWELVDQQLRYERKHKLEPRISVLNEGTVELLIRKSPVYAAWRTGRGSSFAPISFASLLPTRYRALQGILDKCKGITPSFLLTAQDVQNYDPSVPVWLDQFQSYWYLNSIDEFTGAGPTECQLWRL